MGALLRRPRRPAELGAGHTPRGACLEAVARLYGALLRGELLSEGLRRQALLPQVSGVDEVVGQHLSWGLGAQVDADGFGMGGIGGSLGAAGRSGRYGIGFLPAYMIDYGRADRLELVLRECLGVSPLK